ncbi:hypothetical protein BESB_030960 [Besnoitia besnoiti]|uniref:Transmembrane protein n=1 Tax=Besnoitia besnoiti TaxID=94643 RepID=A0A2A9M772_BESBE|nr:hypothetical protein BESB_030960 [Besnoitia besnoiti]PFH31222.1 hypothetical protein BESB_030960 [Besnoitia besnoiti]
MPGPAPLLVAPPPPHGRDIPERVYVAAALFPPPVRRRVELSASAPRGGAFDKGVSSLPVSARLQSPRRLAAMGDGSPPAGTPTASVSPAVAGLGSVLRLVASDKQTEKGMRDCRRASPTRRIVGAQNAFLFSSPGEAGALRAGVGSYRAVQQGLPVTPPRTSLSPSSLSPNSLSPLVPESCRRSPRHAAAGEDDARRASSSSSLASSSASSSSLAVQRMDREESRAALLEPVSGGGLAFCPPGAAAAAAATGPALAGETGGSPRQACGTGSTPRAPVKKPFRYELVHASAPPDFDKERVSSFSLSSLDDGRSVGSALTRKSDRTVASARDAKASQEESAAATRALPGGAMTKGAPSERPPQPAAAVATAAPSDADACPQGGGGGGEEQGSQSAGAAPNVRVRSGKDDASGYSFLVPRGWSRKSDRDEGAAGAGGAASWLGTWRFWHQRRGGDGKGGTQGDTAREGSASGEQPPCVYARVTSGDSGLPPGAPPSSALEKKRREGEGTEETLPGGENLFTDGDDSPAPTEKEDAPESCQGGEDGEEDGGGFWSYAKLPLWLRKSRRRQWMCLGVLVLLLLLVIGLPVLFCLVAPRIVAEQVKAAKIRVLSTSIDQPDATGFLSTIVFEFDSASPVSARVADLPVEIFWSGRKVGRTTVPAFNMDSSTRTVAFSSDFRVTDRARWDAFLTSVMREGGGEWRIVGRASIRALGLTFNDIPFDKTVAIEGPPLPGTPAALRLAAEEGKQGGRQIFQVKQMDLTESDADTLRLRVHVDFLNLSTTSIDSLGEISFLMLYKGTPVGVMRSDGAIRLVRGVNEYTFVGEIHPKVIPMALELGLTPRRAEAAEAKNAGAERGLPARSVEEIAATPRMPSPADVDAFRGALSEMMSSSLSGGQVSVRTLGILATQPLFDAAVRALSVETPVENLFDASETPVSAMNVRQRGGGGVSGTSRYGSGKGLVKEMRFDHLDLSADADGENRARISAKVTVRFLNPLGKTSPLEIRQVTISASLRRGGLQGTPVGVIHGVMVATGPPQRVENPEIPLNRGVTDSWEADEKEASGIAAHAPQLQTSLQRQEKRVNYSEGAAGSAGAFLARTTTAVPSRGASSAEERSPRALAALPEEKTNVLVNTSEMDITFEMQGAINLVEDGRPFSAFIREVVTVNSSFVSLAFTESEAEIQAVTAVGPLSLQRVRLDQTLAMASMGDMRNVKVESFEVMGEAPGAWLIATRVVFPSKAPASVYLGNLGLKLSFQGVPMGYVAGRDVYISQGENRITFFGRLQPPLDATETVSEFFSSAIATPAARRDAETQLDAQEGGSVRAEDAAYAEGAAGADEGEGDGLGGDRRPSAVPTMVVSISSEATTLLDSLLHEDAAASHDLGAPAFLLAGGAQPLKRPLRWIQDGLEGVVMEVPIPQIASSANLLRTVNMTGLRMVLFDALQEPSSAADAEARPRPPALPSPAAAGFGATERSSPLDSAVPMKGFIELYLNNPLGKRLALRMSAIVLDVALSVELPVEAAAVPTPGGTVRPVFAADAPNNRSGETRRVVVGRLRTQLRDLQSEAVGHLFAEAEVGAEPFNASVLRLVVPLDVPLQLEGDGSAFGEFVGAFIEQERVEMFVSGFADTTVHTGFGDVQIRNVDVTASVRLQGLDGLKGSTLRSFEIRGVGRLAPFLFADETPALEAPEAAAPERADAWSEGAHAEDAEAGTGEPFAPSRRLAAEERAKQREREGEEGLLLTVTAQMRNPSEATVEMGAVELDLIHLGTTVGRMRGAKLLLAPGDNFLNLTGGIILNRGTEHAVSSLFSRAILNQDLDLSVAVSHTSAPSHGEGGERVRAPRWLAQALRRAKILPDIPPLAKLIPGMDVRTLLEDFSLDALTVAAAGAPEAAPASLVFEADTKVRARNPLGHARLPMQVESVSFAAAVTDLQGQPVGRLSLPDTPATTQVILATATATAAAAQRTDAAPTDAAQSSLMDVYIKIEGSELVLENGGLGLGQTVRAYLRHPAGGLGLVVAGEASVRLRIGDIAALHIRGLPVERELVFGRSTELKAGSQDVRGAFAPRLETFAFDGAHPQGGVWVTATASMQNPAPVRLLLPRLVFDVTFNETLLGHVWLADQVALQPFPLPTQLSVRGHLFRHATARGLHDLNALVKAALEQVTLGDDAEAEGEEGRGDAREPGTAAPGAFVTIRVNIRADVPDSPHGGDTELLEDDGLALAYPLRLPSADRAALSLSPSYAGSQSLPHWLEVGLDGFELQAPVDGRRILSGDLVKEVVLKALLIRVQEGSLAPVLLDTLLRLRLQSPFGPDGLLAIEKFALDADLRDVTRDSVFGKLVSLQPGVAPSAATGKGAREALSAPPVGDGRTHPCVFEHSVDAASGVSRVATFEEEGAESAARALQPSAGTCAVDLPFAGSLVITDSEAFAAFAASAVGSEAASSRQPGAVVRVEGGAGVAVETPLGRVEVERIAIRQTLPFSGMHAILKRLISGVRMEAFEVKRVVLDDEGKDRILFSARVRLGEVAAEGDAQAQSEAERAAEAAAVEAVEVHAGDLAFDLIARGKIVGTVATKNAVVGDLSSEQRRGRELLVEGELFDDSSARGTPDSGILQLMRDAVGSDRQVHFLIRSNRRMREGQTKPLWLLDAIDQMQLRPSLSGIDSALSLVQGMQLRSLAIAVLDSTRIATDATVSVTARNPLGKDAKIEIEEFAADIKLFSPAVAAAPRRRSSVSGAPRRSLRPARLSPAAASSSDEPIAFLRLASRVPAGQRQEGETLHLELPLSHARFGDVLELAEDGSRFGDYVAAVVNDEAGPTPYEATVFARVSTPFGAFAVEGLKVRAAADLLQIAASGSGPRPAAETGGAAAAAPAGEGGGEAAGTGGGLLEDIKFELLDLKFRGEKETRALDSGAAFDAVVALHLPLDLSLSLGSLAFQVEIPHTPDFSKPADPEARAAAPASFLGSLTLANLTLRPGVSKLEVTGLLDPAAADLPQVSAFLSAAVQGASPHARILGQRVEMKGGVPPLWLSKTVSAMRLWVAMPAAGLDAFVARSFANISLKNVGLSAVSEAVRGRDDVVALSADVTAALNSPFGEGSRLIVRRVGVDVELKRRREPATGGSSERPAAADAERHAARRLQASEGDAPAGTSSSFSALSLSSVSPVSEAELETVGRLVLEDLPLRQVGEEVHVQLADALLRFEDEGSAFAKLALALMQASKSLSVYVRGSASVVLETALGELDLRAVPIALDVPVDGMEIFEGRTLEHLSEGALEHLRVTDFEEEDVQAFHLSTRLVIENSHDIAVHLGPMAFDVTYEDATIAAVVLPDFAMLPGRNEVRLEGVVKPDALDAFNRLASSFFLQSQYTVGVKGTPTSSLASSAASSAASTAASSAAPAPGGDVSEAALLAIARAGIQGRAPHWLREVLAKVQFSVPVSGASMLGSATAAGGGAGARAGDAEATVNDMVKRVELVSIDVDFSGPRDPFVSGEVQVFYELPEKFKIRHEVETLSSEMTIFRQQDAGGNLTRLGSVEVKDLVPLQARPSTSASPSRGLAAASALSQRPSGLAAGRREAAGDEEAGSEELRVHFNDMRLRVHSDQAMADVIFAMVSDSGELEVLLRGHANLRLKTAVGSLDLSRVPVNLKKSFKCIGGLDPETVKNAFQMENFGIQAGKAHGLLASADLRLFMPKAVDQFTVRLGKVTLDLFTPVSREKQEQLGDFTTLSAAALKLVEPHPEFGYVVQAGMVQIADMFVPSNRRGRFRRPHVEVGSAAAGAAGAGDPFESAAAELEAEAARARRAAVQRKEDDGWLVGKAVLLRPVVDVAGEEVAIGTRVIMSNYMNGRPSKLVIRGSSDSSQNPILAAFLEKVEVQVDLPGTQQKLIKGVKISFRNGRNEADPMSAVNSLLAPVNPGGGANLLVGLPDLTRGPIQLRGLPSFNFFVPVIEAVSIYENPVKVPIKFFYADIETFYEGQSLGGVVIDKNDKPDVIPPMQVSHSTPVRIVPKLQNTSAALAIVRNIVSRARKDVSIDAKGEVRIGIQDFRIALDVDMHDLEVTF